MQVERALKQVRRTGELGKAARAVLGFEHLLPNSVQMEVVPDTLQKLGLYCSYEYDRPCKVALDAPVTVCSAGSLPSPAGRRSGSLHARPNLLWPQLWENPPRRDSAVPSASRSFRDGSLARGAAYRGVARHALLSQSCILSSLSLLAFLPSARTASAAATNLAYGPARARICIPAHCPVSWLHTVRMPGCPRLASAEPLTLR